MTMLSTPRWLATLAGLGLALLLLPVAGLVLSIPFSRIGEVLGDRQTQDSLRLSLLLSGAGLGIATLLGVPLGVAVGLAPLPLRRLFKGILVAPMVLPPVVAGVALISTTDPSRPIGRVLSSLGVGPLAFSSGAVVLVAVFVSLPLVALGTVAAVEHVDPGIVELGMVQGLKPSQNLFLVILPNVKRGITAAVLFGFARALGEFGATATFAGNVRGRTQTLPLLIYNRLLDDPGSSVLLGVLLLTIALGIGLVGAALSRTKT